MIEEHAQQRGLRQAVDWKLVGIYFLLVLIGWVNIYASLHSSEPPSIFSWTFRCGKQFVWILTAFGLGGLILFLIPPSWWEGFSLPFYLGVVVLLVAVIFLGIEVKGSRSWFAFGPVRFQPAEVSKITTSLLLATVMSQQGYRMSRLRDFLITVGIIGLPMLCILGESETGSALVYVGFLFVLYREGLSGWLLGLIGLAIVLFIFTLTRSPYVSILILAGILLVCNAFRGPRKECWPRLLIGGGILAALACLPWLWGLLTDSVSARMDFLAQRIYVPRAGENTGYFWSFLLQIKPIYLLLLAAGVTLPVLAYKAYRRRDSFLGISLLVFLVGTALVFSTDFLFDDVLQEHQRKRIEVLLGMKEDPAGVGYNVNQSKIAIGSGGVLGKGFLAGTQTAFGFVPEQTTDFIFCTVGEEWGFAGCLVVILLYVLLMVFLLRDAERSRSAFTRIYGYCVASCIFMHLFINVGMTVGLMPVIGIPLPLLSYGGSSLWAFTILLFIFIALYREEKKYF